MSELLSQAIQLHEAGKIELAVALYRQLIADDPQNIVALYHLGVAAASIKGIDEAKGAYERVLTLDADHVPARVNLGTLMMNLGRFSDAAEHFQMVAEARPELHVARINLGNALAAQGQWDKAIEAFQDVLETHPQLSQLHVSLGNAFSAQSRWTEAVNAYLQATELRQQPIEVQAKLGVAHYRSGNLKDAEKIFREVVHVVGENYVSHLNLAATLARLGQKSEADSAYQVAVQLASSPEDHESLTRSLICDHEIEHALNVLQKWLAMCPDDPIARHYLAACKGDVLAVASEDYIRSEFNKMAENFDEHLVSRLQYRGPDLVSAAMLRHFESEKGSLDILDAGCGTGLIGTILRPYARTLIGVDLSDQMLARARARKIYDELHLAEIVAFLTQTNQQQKYDLVVCADTLVYFGDVNAIFKLFHQALKPAGHLYFTVEAHETTDSASSEFHLIPSGRFRHTRSYLEKTLAQAGFEINNLIPQVIRYEDASPVPGYVVLATKCGVQSPHNPSPEASIEVVQRELAERPNDAWLHFQYGNLLADSSDFAAAVAAFKRARELSPDVAAIHRELGNAYLALGQFEEAISSLEKSQSIEPNAVCANDVGRAYAQSDRIGEAIQAFEKAIEIDPHFAPAIGNLGQLFLQTGDHVRAATALKKLLALEPSKAKIHLLLGDALFKTGDLAGAEVAYRKAVELNPNDYLGHLSLAATIDELGRDSEADTIFQQSLDRIFTLEDLDSITWSLICDGKTGYAARVLKKWLAIAPHDPVAQHYFAACSGQNMARADSAYVQKVFDRYSSTFDDKLLTQLHYRGPELITTAMVRIRTEPSGSLEILDAGCGTGLCGSILKPYAQRLVGVDLSQGMLDKARMRDCYDELTQSELVEYLQSVENEFDVIVCSDTLVYFGELTLAFSAFKNALRPGGQLIFTVEELPAAEASYHLNTSGRFRHTAAYLDRALAISGLEVNLRESETLRHERNAPVQGFLVVATKPEAVPLDENEPEAIRSLRNELAQNQSDARLHFELGNLLIEAGKLDEALKSFALATELAPHVPAAHFGLANAYFANQRFDAAVRAYEQSQMLEPSPITLNNLGNSYAQLNRFSDAIRAYESAIQLDPQFVPAYGNLGKTYLQNKQFERAIAALRDAVRIEPRYAKGHVLLGDALCGCGANEESLLHYHQAVTLCPQEVEYRLGYGAALASTGRAKDAASQYIQALEFAPNDARIFNNMASLNAMRGQLSEAEFCYLRALEIDPSLHETHSNLLFTMQSDVEISGEQLYQESLLWAAKHTAKITRLPTVVRDNDPHRTLRIGYVSPDFRKHPVGYFLEPVLQFHNHAQFSVYCYANQTWEDAQTKKLKSFAKNWRDVAALSDEALAHMIRDDRIDILIDLAGHTADNRLLTFARKPAPLQAGWIGYSGTTGLREMDYVIADRFVIPPSEESFYVEKIWRLPPCYVCFPPPEDDVPIGPLPLTRNGYITFGCFNNLSKISPAVIQLWSAVLLAVPGSQLLMKSKALGDASVQESIRRQFAEFFVAPERIRFEGFGPRSQVLAAYNEVDIGLDPFPFNGGLTTIESLWMGVPLINVRGRRFVGHASESFLQAVGLEDWIVSSAEEYIQKAKEAVEFPEKLAQLRAELRSRLQASALSSHEVFTQNLESAYRAMWQRWCNR